METKIKTQEEVKQATIAYLNKTELHLFKIKPYSSDKVESYYKVITFEREGKHYYATITIRESKVSIEVRETTSDNNFKYYGNNYLNITKKSLFPEYWETKSIPNFKKFRVLTDMIKAEISVTNNTKLISKIEQSISEVTKIDETKEEKQNLIDKIISLFK